MKKFLSVICLFSMLFCLSACGPEVSPVPDKESDITEEEFIEPDNVKDEEEEKVEIDSMTDTFVITVKDYGTIEVELDSKAAPKTVENFKKLVGEGFYDGLTFHRIIDGFMIQGGDPLGNGTGGSDENIVGEFELNGVNNPISHIRGVISMARSAAPDSASSQFFIVHEDSTFLDGEYAGFGYVTSGMEVVDKICESVQVEDGNGTVLPENQPVIESIVMK